MKRIDGLKIAQGVRLIIEGMGEDPTREGLIDTPARAAALFVEMATPKPVNFTTFDAGGSDQIILIRDIPFYSLCEHHIAPFFGVVHVGYIPGDRLVGLSKIPRMVENLSRGLQIQERLTEAIADKIAKGLGIKTVAVIIKGRHLCLEMRGVKALGAYTTTSVIRGRFRENDAARDEFLKLCGEL